jgi:MFS transporter, OFA family, oxalate/formate antiporter
MNERTRNIFVIIAGFWCYFWSWGTFMSLGVFWQRFQDNFDASLDQIALVQSITSSTIQITGLMAGIITQKSPSPFFPVFVGMLLLLLGYIGAAFARTLIELYLSAGAIGIGSSFLTLTSVTVVPAYFAGGDFKNHIGKAQSVITSGSGVGCLVIPFLYNGLIHAVGWRHTLWISGCLSFVCLLPFCLFAFVENPFTVKKGLAFNGLATPSFAFLSLASIIFFFGYWVFNIYLSPYGSDELGMNSNQIGWVLSMVGIVSTVGRLLMGFVTDKISPLYVWMVMMLLKSVCTILIPVTHDMTTFFIVAFFGGLGHAGGILLPQIIKEYYEAQQSPTVYGLVYSLSSVGSILGPIVAGLLVPHIGYLLSFMSIESTIVISLILLSFFPVLKKREKLQILEEHAPLNA